MSSIERAQDQIRRIVSEQDSHAMADFLLDLARSEYHQYAGEVARAQYQHGLNDAEKAPR